MNGNSECKPATSTSTSNRSINSSYKNELRYWNKTYLLMRMDDEGHIIGNHTFDHVELPKLTTTDKIINALYNIIPLMLSTIPLHLYILPYLKMEISNQNGMVMNTHESLGYNASEETKVYAVQALSRQVGNKQFCYFFKSPVLWNGGATAEIEYIIVMMTAEIEYMLSQGFKPVIMEECLWN
ncbi:hypothetical protein H8356DRAFT_1373470 [Neocallimastix lanati (nom. inval.)]|nr:hypothetical protein H8356DRAFT_1373470 [Neocallimastix sp. JGI-2020a]